MTPDDSDESSSPSPVRPIRAVMFDFHGTVAQVEPLPKSVEFAAAQCGVELPEYRSTILADALGALGWVGSGLPAKILPSFAAAWADRDLTEADHREAFISLASQTSGAFDGFAEAVYDRMCSPEGWVIYPDTIPTLRALREADVPVALVSNIGFDLRPVIKHLGFEDLLDHWVLSYEVGWAKPEAAIFREACLRLETDPEECLMVGDSLADAGAKDLGCRTYLVPHTGPGEVVGLDAIPRILGL